MTIGVLAGLYPWTKALHVISVIAWMAGMLYLPRLYVYHCDGGARLGRERAFKVMERRLLKQIINPAMIATWIFGVLLVLTPGVLDWSAGWWHVKLTCVILLSGFHGDVSRWRRDFLEDRNIRPQRFYRIANEVPTVLMVVIVIMVDRAAVLIQQSGDGRASKRRIRDAVRDLVRTGPEHISDAVGMVEHHAGAAVPVTEKIHAISRDAFECGAIAAQRGENRGAGRR